MTLSNPSPHHSRCTDIGSLFVAKKARAATSFRLARGIGLISLLLAGSLCAAGLPPAPLFESSLQFRTGFDSNPTAMSGTSAAPAGSEDTFTYAAGLNASIAVPSSAPANRSLKFTYTGEASRFVDCPTENFSSHRLGWIGQITTGVWKITGEGSTLFVAGSRETLPSVAAVNANAISLWRERRRQWQHRLKVQAQANHGNCLLRATGTLLAYDYLSRAVSGKVPFADRSDAMGAFDLGWRQNASSLWFTGLRVGRQNQSVVPLPNCEFDYSNDYQRIAAGWEGKPSANTTVAFAAGPDFRHYTGAVDTRVFSDRDRTSLWSEGSFSAKPSPKLTLTGKAGRMDWLSSTGKSAYTDTSAETAAVWTATPAWTFRFSAKVHRCDYFPVVRDDWESIVGAGATLKVSSRTNLSLDLLNHRGWNGLPASTGREFRREVVNLGATIKL